MSLLPSFRPGHYVTSQWKAQELQRMPPDHRYTRQSPHHPEQKFSLLSKLSSFSHALRLKSFISESVQKAPSSASSEKSPITKGVEPSLDTLRSAACSVIAFPSELKVTICPVACAVLSPFDIVKTEFFPIFSSSLAQTGIFLLRVEKSVCFFELSASTPLLTPSMFR